MDMQRAYQKNRKENHLQPVLYSRILRLQMTDQKITF